MLRVHTEHLPLCQIPIQMTSVGITEKRRIWFRTVSFVKQLHKWKVFSRCFPWMDKSLHCLSSQRKSQFKLFFSLSSHLVKQKELWVWLCLTMSQKQFKLTGQCVVTSTHNRPSALHRGQGRAELRLRREQHKSSVQLHLHLLTKQLRESNILPSLVFSTVFTLPAHSPRQTSFISP